MRIGSGMMVPEIVDNVITSLTNTTLDAMTPVERRLLERAFMYIWNNQRGRKSTDEITVKKPTRIRGIGPVSNPSTESFVHISDESQHQGLCVHAHHRVSTENSYTERLLLLRPTEPDHTRRGGNAGRHTISNGEENGCRKLHRCNTSRLYPL